MANEEKQPDGVIGKVISLIRTSPLVAMLIWMGYRDVSREAKQDAKEALREQREYENNKFIKEAYIHYRDALQREITEKDKKLHARYDST